MSLAPSFLDKDEDVVKTRCVPSSLEGDVVVAAKDRLLRSPYMPLRQLACDYDRGVLFLRGRLSSFFHKQLAQVAVAGIDGVERVVNEIEVLQQLPYTNPRGDRT